MGVVAGISHNEFPKQYSYVGKKATVIFNYDNSNPVQGTIVRDDAEAPFRTIIQLEDGRFVLATECQYMVNKYIVDTEPVTTSEQVVESPVEALEEDELTLEVLQGKGSPAS